MTDGPPSAPGTRRRRRTHRRSTRNQRDALWALTLLAALAAAFAPVAPTGLLGLDRLLAALLAGVVTMAASRATRSAGLWIAGLATALAIGSPWVAPAALALAIALVLVISGDGLADERQRWPVALVAALAMQSLLRAPALGFFGLPSIITTIAIAPVLWSAWHHSRRPAHRRAALATVVGGGFVLVALVGLGIAGLAARSQVSAATDHARDGLEALRSGDQDTAAGLFDQATREFHRAHDQVSAPWAQPARLVPVVAQQAEALRSVTDSGAELTRTASVAATTAPYRQLRARAGQIDLTTLESMQAPVAASADALASAQATVASVRSPWLLAPLTDNLDRFSHEIDRTLPEARLAQQALTVAPGLLGGSGTRHYYIAFATPAEARFQGGFVGAYGILTASDGRVTLERSGSIEELSTAPGAADRELTGMPIYQERYGRLNPARFPQNLTASPDLPDNATATAQVIPQVGGPSIDGVIYVDPVGLAALLRLTGPVTVPGVAEPLTADDAAQYLLRDQYLAGGTDEARHDGLTAASRATFDALVSRELPSPAEIGSDLGDAMRGGHLLVTTFDADEEAFFTTLGSTGAFLSGAADAGPVNDADHGSDWFSVRTSNASGNKIDSFLRREVDYDATVDPASGVVTASATITLHNDAPASGLPDYVIGNIFGLPRGTNRLYLGFFTADELRSATLDGAELPVESQHEFGGNVYSSLVDLPPGGSATVVLQITGSVRLGRDAEDGYRLGIGHQPLVTDDHLTVHVRSTDPARPIDAAALLAAGGHSLAVSTEPDGASFDVVQQSDLALHVGFHPS